jgi:hypothetical protein
MFQLCQSLHDLAKIFQKCEFLQARVSLKIETQADFGFCHFGLCTVALSLGVICLSFA